MAGPGPDRLAAEDKARSEAQRVKQQAWDAAAAAGRRGGRRPADEPPRTNHNNTELRANITDPDVRVMRNQKGYVAGYNGQLVVTAQQVIVGAVLSWHPVDRTLLHPVLGTCRQQLANAGIGRSCAPCSPTPGMSARFAVADYIEVLYNRQRLHSTLGYRTPAEVLTEFQNAATAT